MSNLNVQWVTNIYFINLKGNNMGYFDNENLRSQESSDLFFTDEELIELYNVLGFSSCSLNLLNGVLQSDCFLVDIEEKNHFYDSIRFKIRCELADRGIN